MAAIESGAGPTLGARLRELEAQAADVDRELATVAERETMRAALLAWQPEHVSAWFDFAADAAAAETRARLRDLLDAVEFQPAGESIQLRYRFAQAGNKLASPRGFEPRSRP